ncbi:hypothetical protein AX15_000519 [Amanita polypyramis BW_CC]|nr:hypothetical protein AX15_000519 [Amanita polypyramis BW_CC]
MDASVTRFHACERFHRCEDVAVANDPESSDTNVTSRTGKRVVYINPVTMGAESWELYLTDTKQCLRTGEPVNTLLVPLSRHSTLPELQAFVRLFKPHRVIPNTLDPRLRGFDWMCIDRMFEVCLTPLAGAAASAIPPTPIDGGDLDLLQVQVDEEGDAAVKNIVGSLELALSWADKGKLRRKLEIMVGYLDPERKSFLDKLLRCRPDSPLPVLSTSKVQISLIEENNHGEFDRDSEDESDGGGAEENHWRTAHVLFGSPTSTEGEQLKWAFLSPKSQNDHDATDEHPIASQNPAVEQPTPVYGDSLIRLTPSSPVRQTANSHLMQGRMLHASSKHARDVKDQPSTPRFRKRSTPEGHVLVSSIHLPTNSSRSANRVTSKRLVLGQHEKTTSLSKYKTPDGPLSKSTEHQLMTANIHHSITLKRRPDIIEPCTTHDENVFVSEPSDRPYPGHYASLDRYRPGRLSQRSSPNRVMASPASPDKHTRVDLGVVGVQTKQPSAAILRQKQKIERTIRSLELAERLAQANPARVVSTYHEKRARLLKQCARNEIKTQYLEALERAKVRNVIPDPHFDRSTFRIVESSQIGVNWDRSRALEEQVRADLARGQWPVFPSLACTDSQPG